MMPFAVSTTKLLLGILQMEDSCILLVSVLWLKKETLRTEIFMLQLGMKKKRSGVMSSVYQKILIQNMMRMEFMFIQTGRLYIFHQKVITQRSEEHTSELQSR